MCTGFIEIALIILPVGFIGRHYHRLSPDLTLHQRVSGVVLLLGLYVVTNLLLLGADQVCGVSPKYMGCFGAVVHPCVHSPFGGLMLLRVQSAVLASASRALLSPAKA
jgi:hypothetical protein